MASDTVPSLESSDDSDREVFSEPATVTSTKKTSLNKAAPAKNVSKAVKPTKTKSEHPKTLDMVVNAINELKERNGSSLRAVVKQISEQYSTINMDKLYPHIKKAIKTGVEKGVLIQTKGTGASGSFKAAKHKPKEKKETEAGKKKVAEKKTVSKTSEVGTKRKKKSDSEKSPAKKSTKAKKTVEGKVTPTKKVSKAVLTKARSPAEGKKVSKPKVAKSAKSGKKTPVKGTPRTPVNKAKGALKQPPSAKKVQKGSTVKKRVVKPKTS